MRDEASHEYHDEKSQDGTMTITHNTTPHIRLERNILSMNLHMTRASYNDFLYHNNTCMRKATTMRLSVSYHLCILPACILPACRTDAQLTAKNLMQLRSS